MGRYYAAAIDGPGVTIVLLSHNRRDELQETLTRMLFESDYERVEAIVVDNASTDGSPDVVLRKFPGVRVIALATNEGVPALNRGFAAATGDYVLVLDDDCYLPADGLSRAVAAAVRHDADLVSFKVASTFDPEFVFSDNYRTGLLSFWGCAWLARRTVLDDLGGYDSRIPIWGNELELMLRFFDRGYRHLHLPEVVAQHMKVPWRPGRPVYWATASYRINSRHWAYTAAKLLRPRDAAHVIVALLARNLRDAVREDSRALRAVAETLRGFARGLHVRVPVRHEVSALYRANFETFTGPWTTMRPPRELLRQLPREVVTRRFRGSGRVRAPSRRADYFAQRAALYPEERSVLQV